MSGVVAQLQTDNNASVLRVTSSGFWKNDCYPRCMVDVELVDCVEIACESWNVTRWCHMELSQLATNCLS
jgi:hypothetical protein